MPAVDTITPRDIAREAAKISGLQPSSKRHRAQEQFQSLLELYGHILNAPKPTLTNPVILNSVLCETNGAPEWRAGVPAEFKSLPKAEACPGLFRLWWRCLEKDIEKVLLLSDEKKRVYCEEQYAFFLCIRPFENMVGRTALLLYYMLRQYVGLPRELVTYQNAPALLARVKKYRKEVFLPFVENRTFMLS